MTLRHQETDGQTDRQTELIPRLNSSSRTTKWISEAVEQWSSVPRGVIGVEEHEEHVEKSSINNTYPVQVFI